MADLLVGTGIVQRIMCRPVATPAPRHRPGSVARRQCVTARRIAELSKQLGQAAMLTGRPNLTSSEVQADDLLDWRHINAA